MNLAGPNLTGEAGAYRRKQQSATGAFPILF